MSCVDLEVVRLKEDIFERSRILNTLWKSSFDLNGVNENGKKWFKIGNLMDDCEDTVEGHLDTRQKKCTLSVEHIKSWAQTYWKSRD